MSQNDPRVSSSMNQITEVTRRAIVDHLLLRVEPYHGRRMEHVDFLGRVLPLAKLPATDGRFNNLYDDLVKHTVDNYDYTESEVLLRYAKILTCPDQIFGNFLTETLHPVVRDSVDERNELLTLYNEQLRADRFEIVEDGKISGRPLYKMRTVADTILGIGAASKSSNSAACAGTDIDDLKDTFLAQVPKLAKSTPMPSVANTVNEIAADTMSTERAMTPRKYDVVLTYASEQRTYVQEFAEILQNKGVEVFYDGDNASDFWGKDLVETLGPIYNENSRFCVMFISKAYAEKDWTNYERKQAFSRALERRDEYVLPVRFDNTILPGLIKTLGYINAKDTTPSELSELLLKKLAKK